MKLELDLIRKICKKVFLSTLVAFIFLSCTPAFCAHLGRLEYNDVLFDYSKLDEKEILSEADSFFEKYTFESDKSLKKQYGSLSMGKYYLLTRIEPADCYPYVQLARLYIDIDKRRFAREYLSTALNIEKDNAFTNYYYGEYYYKYKDYRRALRHYRIAYRNGYSDFYDINLKMAILYEKFGDIVKSLDFYQRAYAINSENPDLPQKIHSLRDLNYGKSEYYNNIRE